MANLSKEQILDNLKIAEGSLAAYAKDAKRALRDMIGSKKEIAQAITDLGKTGVKNASEEFGDAYGKIAASFVDQVRGFKDLIKAVKAMDDLTVDPNFAKAQEENSARIRKLARVLRRELLIISKESA
ncbi:MAG TPA: hypothetical protein ENN30_00330 [Candidatus Woesearchaeota archaeon]|nr:hypothetical protein [Candidatus Woesearchaeota archaeon]